MGSARPGPSTREAAIDRRAAPRPATAAGRTITHRPVDLDRVLEGCGSTAFKDRSPAYREYFFNREMERWIALSSVTDDPIRYPERSIGNAVPRLTLQILAAMIEKIPYRNILEGLLFHFDRRRPALFLTLKARRLERMHTLKPVIQALAVGTLDRVCRAEQGLLRQLGAQLTVEGSSHRLAQTIDRAPIQRRRRR